MGARGESGPGEAGEKAAARFLRKLGYGILRKNYRARSGEIDIIARDGEEVVFVEVKTRSAATWGDPENAVTPSKQMKVCRAAEEFASRNRLRERPLRFDIVAILIAEGQAPECRHYKDAFAIPPFMR